jgi:hypothetical protein
LNFSFGTAKQNNRIFRFWGGGIYPASNETTIRYTDDEITASLPNNKLMHTEANPVSPFAAARAWNVLPIELKSMHDTQIFKRKLKTFLYDYVYTN